jgi:hypothetical protein
MNGTGKLSARAAEAVKSAAIAVLAVSALSLGWSVVQFDDTGERMPLLGYFAEALKGGRPATGPGETSGGYAAGERPLCIIITNEHGERFGAKYDAAQMELVYARTSSVFGEAFGSAAELGETNEAEWRAALDMPGIYYAYPASVSVEALDRWFGTDMSSGGETDIMKVRRLCVVFGAEGDRLLLQDAETGRFFGADAASLSEESQVVGLFGSNGVRFAFETAEGGSGDPYAVLMPDTAHPVIAASNPMADSGNLGGVLSALGVSNQLQSSYPESDGTMVYVSNTFTFSLDPNGAAAYRHTGAAPPGAASGAAVTEEAAVAAARSEVDNTLGRTSGDAEIFFAGVTREEQGVYTVSFEYSAAGGRIYLRGGESAASVTVVNGEVTDMTLNFRQYAITGETVTLMPESLAFAAAGGEFALCYFDDGGDAMIPEWAELGP